MSFLGFDLLDGLPTGSFLSGDISDEGSGSGGAEDLPQQRVPRLPDWDSESVSNSVTIVFEPAEEDSETSSFVIDGVSIEEREEDGITILSSGPSSLASSFTTSHDVLVATPRAATDTPRSIVRDSSQQPQQMLAMSVANPQLSTESVLSLSTAESMFTMHCPNVASRSNSSVSSCSSSDGERSLVSSSPNSYGRSVGSAASRSSFLSLSPSSFPSSVVTSMSLSNGTLGDCMPRGSIRSLTDELGWLSLSSLASSPTTTTPATVSLPYQGTTSAEDDSQLAMVTGKAEPPAWYEELSTERDWQLFRERALQMLDAVGGGDGLDGMHNNISAEELLALLIEQEEEAFWAAKNAQSSGVVVQRTRPATRHEWGKWPPTSSGWKFVGEAALVVAVAAAAPVFVLPLVRRHVLASN